jgi:hypothetical protein
MGRSTSSVVVDLNADLENGAAIVQLMYHGYPSHPIDRCGFINPIKQRHPHMQPTAESLWSHRG